MSWSPENVCTLEQMGPSGWHIPKLERTFLEEDRFLSLKITPDEC